MVSVFYWVNQATVQVLIHPICKQIIHFSYMHHQWLSSLPSLVIFGYAMVAKLKEWTWSCADECNWFFL